MNAARDFVAGCRIFGSRNGNVLHIHLFIVKTGGRIFARFRWPSNDLGEHGGLAITSCTRSLRRCTLRKASRRICAVAARLSRKNLRATAQLASSAKRDLEAWSALSDASSGKNCARCPGVGPKIANCVMAFAYERLRAFPNRCLDRARVEATLFSGRKKMTAQRLGSSPRLISRTPGCSAAVLFHQARSADGAIGRLRSSPLPPDGMSEVGRFT